MDGEYVRAVAPLLDELLELESAGWRSLCDGTAGDFYGSVMTADARMVLAGGVVMTRSEVADALRHAPPWASFTIEAPTVTQLGETIAMLVYTGTGHRDGGDDFTAIMTTVYAHGSAGWRIAHYQQTSLG